MMLTSAYSTVSVLSIVLRIHTFLVSAPRKGRALLEQSHTVSVARCHSNDSDVPVEVDHCRHALDSFGRLGILKNSFALCRSMSGAHR